MLQVSVRLIADNDRARIAQIMSESDLELSEMAFEVERPPDIFPIFVAEYGGQIEGFIEGRFDSHYDERLGVADDYPQAWIYLIIVQPNVRRLGLGRQLLHYFAKESLQHECTFLACSVDSTPPTDGRTAFFTAAGMSALTADEDDQDFGGPLQYILARLSAQGGSGLS